MDGKKLIDEMCKRLDAKNIRVHDSKIIWKISELSQFELEELVNYPTHARGDGMGFRSQHFD